MIISFCEVCCVLTLGQKIKKFRTDRGLTQKQLAEMCGTYDSAIRKYEAEKNIPRIDMIKKIANALGVHDVQLLTDIEDDSIAFSLSDDDSFDVPRFVPGQRLAKIPVFDRIYAGRHISDYSEYLCFLPVDENIAETGDFYGLQIDDNSMEPRILSGDIVIVKRQNYIDSGDIAILLIGTEDAICKRVVKNNDGLTLISFNPSVAPVSYTKKEVEEIPVRIVGRVVELRAKL